MHIFTFTLALTAFILAIVAVVYDTTGTNSSRQTITSNNKSKLHSLQLPANGTFVVELRGRVTFTVPPSVHGYVYVTTHVGDRQFQHVIDTMVPEHYPDHAYFCHTFVLHNAQADKVTHTFESSIPIENFKVQDEEIVLVEL